MVKAGPIERAGGNQNHSASLSLHERRWLTRNYGKPENLVHQLPALNDPGELLQGMGAVHRLLKEIGDGADDGLVKIL